LRDLSVSDLALYKFYFLFATFGPGNRLNENFLINKRQNGKEKFKFVEVDYVGSYEKSLDDG